MFEDSIDMQLEVYNVFLERVKRKKNGLIRF